MLMACARTFCSGEAREKKERYSGKWKQEMNLEGFNVGCVYAILLLGGVKGRGDARFSAVASEKGPGMGGEFGSPVSKSKRPVLLMMVMMIICGPDLTQKTEGRALG